MKNFREMYPERATVGEDGICRWSCEIDLKKDHYSRDLTMKIGLIVGAAILLMMLGIMWSVNDFTFVWIPVVICGSVPLICFLSYEIYRLAVGSKCLVAYEMDHESIVLIRNPRERKTMEGMALATGLLCIADGNPIQGVCRAAGVYGASQPVATKFRKIRKIRGHAESSMIDLKNTFAIAQVWTHPEDYGTILDFVRAHADNAVEAC